MSTDLKKTRTREDLRYLILFLLFIHIHEINETHKKMHASILMYNAITMPPVYVQNAFNQNKDQLLHHVDDLLLQFFAL